MTDKMLFSLSIFFTGLGAGIALAALVSPRSRPATRGLIGRKSAEDLLNAKAGGIVTLTRGTERWDLVWTRAVSSRHRPL